MNRNVFAGAFALGLLTVAWVGWGFVGTSWLALLMTALIAAVFLMGAQELRRFRTDTAALGAALAAIPDPLPALGPWLDGVPASLQHTVRLRIEGERVALPGPALTPYLVGLLVMLGMLGTFLGMVVTFKGAVFALEGSTDLQAIRTALAAPIKGLGLSFGTSVAGVAASAMLGLMSAVSRRERMDVARQLDRCIATLLRPFSLAWQREASLRALQAQAQVLPGVVEQLQAMVQGIEQRSGQLNAQLLAQQGQFHGEVSVAYTRLAQTVGESLKDSLATGARLAGDTIRPVVETAMRDIAQESARAHQRLVDATQAQLDGLSAGWAQTARGVTEGWSGAAQEHARSSAQLLVGLEQSLGALAQRQDERSAALLASVADTAARAQAAQAEADAQRLAGWTQSLQAMADALQAGSARSLDDAARLLAQSEALVRQRIEADAAWAQQQGARMDQLHGLWTAELAALRSEEAARGVAAVDRLDALQAAVAQHLASLGAALEAPLTRLLQTAAEVPQSAAEVITQLRQEMSRLNSRDNQALEERAALMERISTLLQGIEQASGGQRQAIESLVVSAAETLRHTSSQVAETLQAQAGRAADVAAQMSGSAVELSSLGESFSHGVQLFSASHEKLIGSLQRIEAAISQSMARSDEQLAYYVAQAREVIDLSISSQQGIVEDLRRLRHEAAAEAGEAR